MHGVAKLEVGILLWPCHYLGGNSQAGQRVLERPGYRQSEVRDGKAVECRLSMNREEALEAAGQRQ